MKRMGLVLLVAVLMSWVLPTKAQSNCMFYGEAVEGPMGYNICDDADARFLSAFQTWGLQKIGYPISLRYNRDGFITQAFQKAIMQWRADSQTVVLVNIFDDLHNDGFDGQLLSRYQTPQQFPAGWDGEGATFEQVVATRQALLNVRPALNNTYFAAGDPLTFFGLPTSEVEDMGNHYAIRLQRAVLQEWKEEVPWAAKGQVTIANGGDIAKTLGGLPTSALVPESAANVPPPAATATQAPAATATQAPPPSSFNNCQADPYADSAPNWPVRIVTVDKSAEVVRLENVSDQAIDLTGWRMCSIRGNQEHMSISGTLSPGEIRDYPHQGGNIWSNSDSDPGALYNASGQLISYWPN